MQSANLNHRTDSFRQWVLSASLLVLACSCGAEGQPGSPPEGMKTHAPAPPNIHDSAGVTIVENPEAQWAPGSEWQVGDLLTSIGDVQGDPAHELFRAQQATRQSDGTVVVGLSDSGEIRFFRQDGTFIRTVGSTGGGPGEFRGAGALRALKRVAGDTLFTWDLYGQLASIFGPDGEFVRSFQLFGPAQRHYFVGMFGDRSLLMKVMVFKYTGPVEGMPEGVMNDDLMLLTYDPTHSLADSLPGTPDSDFVRARWGPSGSQWLDAPFARETSINAGGSRVYIATGYSDEIAVYDQSGTLQMLIRRTLKPERVTPEMVRLDRARQMEADSAYLERNDPDRRLRRMIAELSYPPVLPPYAQTVLDTEMNLWVEDFRGMPDQPHTWSVFDSEGIWLGRVTIPADLEIYEIGADYILGRSLDELDIERIQVYQVLKNHGEPDGME